MPIIYEPKGKASEYSDLAVNLFTGCEHACTYCYCPAIRYQSLDQWSTNPLPRKNILSSLEKDAKKMQGESRHVLFSFMSDPYQNEEASQLTRSALLILEAYQFKNVQVLTKAGQRASADFDILQRNGWKFGSTIIFRDDKHRQEYEPGAPTIQSRIDAVKLAHEMGIFTWVSIEPVIIPGQSILVMNELLDHVDLWKVGKLNHNKSLEKNISWPEFYNAASQALSGKKVYWKEDLLKACDMLSQPYKE